MRNQHIAARWSDAGLGATASHAEMRDVMEAIGSELIDLGQASAALQAMLRPTQRPDRQGLQALDLFTQRLFALADFLATLTPAIDGGCSVDPSTALATVCLSDMARRLANGSYRRGSQDANPLPSAEVEAGVMDLF